VPARARIEAPLRPVPSNAMLGIFAYAGHRALARLPGITAADSARDA